MTTAAAVRERPILFSGPMVRAILEGSKTQTRRVVMNLNPSFLASNPTGAEIANAARNPYGQPGDRLWVRETFYCDDYRYPDGPVEEMRELLYYRERDEAPGGHCYTGFSGETMDAPWRPSIHMPRWACRLTLELTEVRVEPLQDISELDALAEGVEGQSVTGVLDGQPGEYIAGPARDQYRELWDSLNAKRGFGWDVNPWVWVLSFRTVEDAA